LFTRVVTACWVFGSPSPVVETTAARRAFVVTPFQVW
jgi:hypothetical protein